MIVYFKCTFIYSDFRNRMSACLFVTSNWTDMVSLYREAFHTSWEGLKLFRGRLQLPSKVFWIFITSVAVYSLYHSGSESYPAIFKATNFNFIPVLQCTVCTILDHNLLLPYLWQPFWIFYLCCSVQFVPLWIRILSRHICGGHVENICFTFQYSKYT